MTISSKPLEVPSDIEHRDLSSLERLFEEALRRGVFPGASLLVGTPREVLCYQTWGHCRIGGNPVDFSTRFDLASLTKPLITAPLSIWSISSGKIDLDDPLSRFFPSAVLPRAKRDIRISHLLSHCSGLPPYRPFYGELLAIPADEKLGSLLVRILDDPLIAPPGHEAHYSDLGFQLLGIILETVWGKPLDLLASEVLLGAGRLTELPLPLEVEEELGFVRLEAPPDPTVPSEPVSRARGTFAATEACPWRNRILEGEVHDENAYSMGGVAGHAGLFGTAAGVYRLLSSLWSVYNRGVEDPRWSCELLSLFWSRRKTVPNSTWALGFDTPSDKGSSAGVYFSPRSVGHLGFTGTSFWMDLDREILVILLTNRVHPTRKNEKIREFRPLLHNSVMKAYHGYSRH